MEHLERSALYRLVDGEMDETELKEALAHLKACYSCAAEMSNARSVVFQLNKIFEIAERSGELPEGLRTRLDETAHAEIEALYESLVRAEEQLSRNPEEFLKSRVLALASSFLAKEFPGEMRYLRLVWQVLEGLLPLTFRKLDTVLAQLRATPALGAALGLTDSQVSPSNVPGLYTTLFFAATLSDLEGRTELSSEDLRTAAQIAGNKLGLEPALTSKLQDYLLTALPDQQEHSSPPTN